MSSTKHTGQGLERLRAGYRVAFQEWISARQMLGAVPGGGDAESEAQAHEVAAALEYRNARNHLTDAMSGWSNRDGIAVEVGRHPSPNPEDSLARAKGIERREWLKDFVLALMLIVLAVTGGALLSLMDFSPKG